MTKANQASEDLEAKLNTIIFARFYDIPNKQRSTIVKNLQTLIRTEKLKLLAEVREQTTIFKIKAHDKKGQPHLYEAGRGVPTEVLAKLEAEL